MTKQNEKHTLFLPFLGLDSILCAILCVKEKPDTDVFHYHPGIPSAFGDSVGAFGSTLVIGAMDRTSLVDIANRSDSTTWIRPNVPDDYTVKGVESIITQRQTHDGCAALTWKFFKDLEAEPEVIAIASDATMGHYRLPNAWAVELAISTLSNPFAVDEIFESGYGETAARVIERNKVDEAAADILEFMGEDKPAFDTDQVGSCYAMFPDPIRFRVGAACAGYYARKHDTAAFAVLHGPAVMSMGFPNNKLLAYGASTTQLAWFSTTYSGMTVYDVPTAPAEPTLVSGSSEIITPPDTPTLISTTGEPLRKPEG